MINNQNFIFFNIHKSATPVATAVDLNKSNRVATGNRLSRLSRDWSVVYASLFFSSGFQRLIRRNVSFKTRSFSCFLR